MPTHLSPPPSRSRRLGALALAVSVGLLAVVLINRPSGDDRKAPLEAEQDTTVPSVLGSILDRPTTLAPADPASPATLPPSSTTAPSTTRPRTTGTTFPPVTLVPPVSITSPPRTIPPSTDTTVDPEPAPG